MVSYSLINLIFRSILAQIDLGLFQIDLAALGQFLINLGQFEPELT